VPAPSLSLLLLAAVVYVAISAARPGRVMKWMPVMLGAVVTLISALWLTDRAMPTAGSYPNAENYRVVRAAVATAQREVPGADCVVIVDGSSIFTHGVEPSVLKNELSKTGLKPCVLSLRVLGGEHFEREWMARCLREALPPETRERMDSLPTVWVKELHWTYESHPARFVASNADTPRILAHCEPAITLGMVSALHGNWKNDCRSDKLSGLAAWRTYPVAETAAAIRQGVFNLFHVGQLQRLLEPDPGPFEYVRGEGELAPMGGTKGWWKDRQGLDKTFDGSSRFKTRRWFERLLEDAPSSWPQRPGFELLLATAPGQNQFVQDYAAELEKLGSLNGRPLLLPARDQELRRQLDSINLWRDYIHLEAGGAEIYSRWLANKLRPRLAAMKNQLSAKP